MTSGPVTSRRDDILGAALHLFSRHGYAGTSMRTLAKEVGISAAALYRHFPSKLVLFEKVLESRLRDLGIREYLQTLRTVPDIEDLLRGVSLHLLTTARRDPELLRLLMLTSVSNDDAARKLLQDFRMPYVEFLIDELQRRMREGHVRQVDAGITARCFIAMVMGCAMNSEFWNHLEGVCYDTLDVVTNNVPIFARGLRPALGDDVGDGAGPVH